MDSEEEEEQTALVCDNGKFEKLEIRVWREKTFGFGLALKSRVLNWKIFWKIVKIQRIRILIEPFSQMKFSVVDFSDKFSRSRFAKSIIKVESSFFC